MCKVRVNGDWNEPMYRNTIRPPSRICLSFSGVSTRPFGGTFTRTIHQKVNVHASYCILRGTFCGSSEGVKLRTERGVDLLEGPIASEAWEASGEPLDCAENPQ